MKKKLIFVSIYLGFWAFIILEHLFLSYLIHSKAWLIRVIHSLFMIVMPSFTVYHFVAQFKIGKNTNLYFSIFSSLIFVILFTFWSSYVDKQRIKKNGKETIGIVYDAWGYRFKNLVRINYKVKNKDFTTFSEIDNKESLSIGDTVTVIYYINNPDIYVIKEFRNF